MARFFFKCLNEHLPPNWLHFFHVSSSSDSGTSFSLLSTIYSFACFACLIACRMPRSRRISSEPPGIATPRKRMMKCNKMPKVHTSDLSIESFYLTSLTATCLNNNEKGEISTTLFLLHTYANPPKICEASLQGIIVKKQHRPCAKGRKYLAQNSKVTDVCTFSKATAPASFDCAST